MAPIETVQERTRNIRAVVFDFDGTLTDNCELIGFPDGAVIKSRSHYDGQGISLLRDIGLRVALATNESEQNARAAIFLVNKWNGLPSTQPSVFNSKPWYPVTLFTGVGHFEKVHAVLDWLKGLSILPKVCAAMGDDLVDLPLLQAVGFRAAPITAEKVVKEMADFVSIRPAGHGAVRDFVNFILECRGIDQTALRPF